MTETGLGIGLLGDTRERAQRRKAEAVLSESAKRKKEHEDRNPERGKPGRTRALQPSGGKALSHYGVDFRRWLSLNVRPTSQRTPR